MTIPHHKIVEARATGARTYAELDKAMQPLRDQGLLDCKMTIFHSKDTTTAGVARVAAKVLRQYGAGKGVPLVVS